MGKADFPLGKHLAPTWSDLEYLAEFSDQVEKNNKLQSNHQKYSIFKKKKKP